MNKSEFLAGTPFRFNGSTLKLAEYSNASNIKVSIDNHITAAVNWLGTLGFVASWTICGKNEVVIIPFDECKPIKN
jgi:hypothetical protein